MFTIPFTAKASDLTYGVTAENLSSPKSLEVYANGNFPPTLVVDDSEINRKMLSKLLKTKKIECSMAEDGEVALETIEKDMNSFRLIFIDNLMPVMNGVDATKALRERGYPYLIVGLTGNVMKEELEEFISAGLSIAFSKPVRVPQINMLIEFIHESGTLHRAGHFLSEVHGKYVWTLFTSTD